MYRQSIRTKLLKTIFAASSVVVFVALFVCVTIREMYRVGWAGGRKWEVDKERAKGRRVEKVNLQRNSLITVKPLHHGHRLYKRFWPL